MRVDGIHTYIVLHYDVRLHAIQASIIETGFKTNEVINNFIHWKLKEKSNYSVLVDRLGMILLPEISILSKCDSFEVPTFKTKIDTT